MQNPFAPAVSEYKRDLDILDGYQNDAALYLHLQTGEPLEKCKEYVIRKAGKDSGNLHNPKALVMVRDRNQDRQPKTLTFMGFLGRVTRDNLLLSPSMAAYVPASQVKSTHSGYIAEGVQKRDFVKGEMKKAKEQGNKLLALVKKGEQNTLKINNNSYSGATVSQATILHYKSTHSTLTSTCRTATSYANAANEKFLAGNRHYYDFEIIKANLMATINNTSSELIEQTCNRWGLHYPTPEETMECIRHSSDLYTPSTQQYAILNTLVTNMTPVQRAAVVYVGDMYHLHKHNPTFVINLLTELSSKPETVFDVSDETFSAIDNDTRMLATFLCYEEVASRGLGDVKKESPDAYALVKATAVNVLQVVEKYSDVIRAFWLTTVVPSSVHAFPTAYRKVAVVSDTDSTMFTSQYWVEKAFGMVSFKPDAKRLVFGVVYIVSEIVQHILAIQSANMGVEEEHMRLLAMKNEYYFAVLSLTSRSKHYYASRDAQEGLMLKEPELEVKGVGLRDSKVPPEINEDAKQLMLSIIQSIKNEEEISVIDILTHVADMERKILATIDSGSPRYMSSGQVKSMESYKTPEKANYIHYGLWNDVFGPTYGMIKPPPYTVVKVSLAASNRTEIDAWCERMNNPEIAARLKKWLLEKRRKDLKTILVPAEMVESSGIPKEIVAGIDKRKIVANIAGVYYLMLEPLGIFMQDKRITRLVSDMY